MQRPDKIAICFIDNDISRSHEQMGKLIYEGLYSDFEIEWQFKSDKFKGPYSNFSQIVNEAIVETESEFMVFVNPKTIVSREDVNIMVNDLCSGFAWTAICSFGFWAATKELFRKIGLLDERFIGSEYEDNDFVVRLKQADLAINYRYDSNKYPYLKAPILPPMRSSAKTLYTHKWKRINDTYYKTKKYVEEKRLPRKLQIAKRSDISDTWLKWDDSKSDGINHIWRELLPIKISDKVLEQKYKLKCPAEISMKTDGDEFQLTFNCNVETELGFTITNAYPIDEERYKQIVAISNNRWYRCHYEKDIDHEIRIFHEGRMIYHDSLLKYPIDKKIEIGLCITQFNEDV